MNTKVTCNYVAPNGDICDGGRVPAPNPQFTRPCQQCRGDGEVEQWVADRFRINHLIEDWMTERDYCPLSGYRSKV